MTKQNKPVIAIACGGTGGHLFPGLAVADALLRRGTEVTLLISPKEVDQEGVKTARGMKVVTLPAVAFSGGNVLQFATGFAKSFAASKRLFAAHPPQAVLAMGGFTSAPPVVAGKACGAVTFLHESNTIPGKANRWLAHMVEQAFVGFPSAASRLRNPNVVSTGTPVRAQFQACDAMASRMVFGLDGKRPVILVMGGSQGATGINELFLQALPYITAAAPELQVLHLTGLKHFEEVRAVYRSMDSVRAVVRPFLTEMEMALSAATLSLSRAGASSLAELARLRVPAILVPYPAAADNHQYYNARAFGDTGAALLMEQRGLNPEQLARALLRLLQNEEERRAMQTALEPWHAPHAAELIADKMLALVKLIHPQQHRNTHGRGDQSSSLMRHHHVTS